MTERHEIWKLADGLQMDLRAAASKLVELRARLSSLDLPDASSVECEHCGLTFRAPVLLAEHLYMSHGGPVPAHWREIEARSTV